MEDGGSAFPTTPDTVTDKHGDLYQIDRPGMSLRDWFAGMAMAGICSDPSIDSSPEVTAEVSYVMADAMLAEREVKK